MLGRDGETEEEAAGEEGEPRDLRVPSHPSDPCALCGRVPSERASEAPGPAAPLGKGQRGRPPSTAERCPPPPTSRTGTRAPSHTGGGGPGAPRMDHALEWPFFATISKVTPDVRGRGGGAARSGTGLRPYRTSAAGRARSWPPGDCTVGSCEVGQPAWGGRLAWGGRPLSQGTPHGAGGVGPWLEVFCYWGSTESDCGWRSEYPLLPQLG